MTEKTTEKKIPRRILNADESAAIYLKAIVCDLAVQLVASIIVSAVTLAGGSVPNCVNFFLMLAIQLTFFLAVFLSAKPRSASLAIRVKRVRLWAIPLCMALAVVAVECFIVPATYFSILLGRAGFVAQTVTVDGALSVTLFVFASVAAAPFCEELLFRGALLGGLAQKRGAAAAILLSGLTFALMHMNPEQTVYQFLLGTAAAYLALSSGSVVPGMILHASSNLFAVLIDFAFAPAGIAPVPSAAALVSMPGLWIPLGIVMLAAGAAAFFAAGKLLHEPDRRGGIITAFGGADGEKKSLAARAAELRGKGDEESEDIRAGRKRSGLFGKRTHIIYLALGMAICLVMWVLTLVTGMTGAV